MMKQPKKVIDTKMRYIQKIEHKHCTSYNIRKWDGEKIVFYGAFPSLQEAKEYRDYLIENNWDISLIHKPQLLYIHCNDGKYDVVPTVGNKKVYVGRFNTVEDAIYERDRFLQSGCDFDNYFTGTDDTTDDGERFLQGKLSTGVIFETGPRNDIGIYNHCIRRRHY